MTRRMDNDSTNYYYYFFFFCVRMCVNGETFLKIQSLPNSLHFISPAWSINRNKRPVFTTNVNQRRWNVFFNTPLRKEVCCCVIASWWRNAIWNCFSIISGRDWVLFSSGRDWLGQWIHLRAAWGGGGGLVWWGYVLHKITAWSVQLYW